MVGHAAPRSVSVALLLAGPGLFTAGMVGIAWGIEAGDRSVGGLAVAPAITVWSLAIGGVFASAASGIFFGLRHLSQKWIPLTIVYVGALGCGVMIASWWYTSSN